jgi:hypothetical protein
MEQLFFFSELPSIDVDELEGRIDPALDGAFLAEMAAAFAAIPDLPVAVIEEDAA